MKSKILIKLILFAAIPILAVYILFRLNTYAGLLGLVAYIGFAAVVNRSLYYRFRGQKDYQKGNLRSAANWFGKAAKSSNTGSQLKVNYGFILLKSGQLAEAEKVLQECVESSKTADEKNLAKSNLALVLWKKGELDNAVTMLQEVISQYKTTAIYGSLGYLMIEKGDLDEALKFNLEACEYNPDNAIILDNLAHLHHLRGEMDKAAEVFKKLIDKAPHFPEAYYDYGRYLDDISQKEEAAEMYRKALTCAFSFNSTITREQVQKCLDDVSA